MRLINRLPAFLIVIFTALIATIIGVVVIFVLTLIEKRGRWDQLASPPGDIVRLVTGDVDHVVVETAAGATYEIFCPTGEEDYPCLREVESPRDVFQFPCDEENFPPPSGLVKEQLNTCIEYEYMIRTQYVLREDGSLWRWTVRIFPYGQVARFFYFTLLSLILGLIGGLIVVVYRK